MKRTNFSPEWLNSWENLFKNRNNASIIIGFILLFILVFGFLYLGSRRIFFSEYYPVTFTMKFLEDIVPGSKIRFHASLIVGQVESIESNFQIHKIHSKIKKDFFIPKKSSRVSIQTWGYFGQKFINITILEGFYPEAKTYEEYKQKDEIYSSNDLIPIDTPANISKAMQEFHSLLSDENEKEKGILYEKLYAIKNMISKIRRNKYLKNYFWMRLRRSMAKFRRVEMPEEYTNWIDEVDKDMQNISENMHILFPKLRKITDHVSRFVDYKNPDQKRSNDLLYDEDSYDTLLIYSIILNRRLKIYRKSPYKLFFE